MVNKLAFNLSIKGKHGRKIYAIVIRSFITINDVREVTDVFVSVCELTKNYSTNWGKSSIKTAIIQNIVRN